MMKRTPLDCLLGLYQPSWETKKKGVNMKPKCYPYSGNKKESNTIVKLALDSSKVTKNYYSPLLSVKKRLCP